MTPASSQTNHQRVPEAYISSLLLLFLFRKSLSWHTALRIRRKSEKRDKEGRKLENGYRKSQDGLANKVSVKVTSVKTHLEVPL